MPELPIPRFRPSWILAAAGLLLLGIALAYPLGARSRLAAEGAIYLLLLLACAASPALRVVFARAGRPRLAVLALVFAVAVAAQLTKSYGAAYPFVRWTMYSSVAPQSRFPQFEASLASGNTIPFPFSEVTPSSSPRAFLTGLARRLHGVQSAADEALRWEREAALQDLLLHVANSYNGRNPADPVVAVRAAFCDLPLRDFRGPESYLCEQILAFDVVPEQEP